MTLVWLTALFVGMPMLELIVLLKINEYLGLWHTFGLVILTGVVGAFLARTQGLMVFLRIQKDLAQGRMPAPQIIDGVMILAAGLLLVTPGLITDTVGFLLLIPPMRAVIRARLRKWIERKLTGGHTYIDC